MVKILSSPDPWWAGAEMTCSNCRTVFRIEADDDVSYQGTGGVSFPCPVCGTETALGKTEHELKRRLQAGRAQPLGGG